MRSACVVTLFSWSFVGRDKHQSHTMGSVTDMGFLFSHAEKLLHHCSNSWFDSHQLFYRSFNDTLWLTDARRNAPMSFSVHTCAIKDLFCMWRDVVFTIRACFVFASEASHTPAAVKWVTNLLSKHATHQAALTHSCTSEVFPQ